MDKKEIAVIVPNYNNEKYIIECVDSILNQTYPIKEIIIYDDASTDGSKDILKNLEKIYENVFVIYGDVNVGVSCARDIAIKKASTPFVTMIDADDFYYDNMKIANEVEYLDDNTCVFSQVVDVDKNGRLIKSHKLKRLGSNTRFRLVTRLFGSQCPRDFIFPKDIYLSIGGYRNDMKLFEDWELSLRFLSKCRFVYSGSYGTAYRHKDYGLSKSNPKEQLKAKKNAFQSNKDVLAYTILERITFYFLLYINYVRAIIRRII